MEQAPRLVRPMPAQPGAADDLQRLDYSPDREDAKPLEGWVLAVVGKGIRQRDVPVPTPLVGRLGAYLASRGLQARIEAVANRVAFLLGKASDLAEQASQLAAGQFDAEGSIAAAILLRPGHALFRRLRTGAQELGRCAGRRAFRVRRHAPATPHACVALDRGRNSGGNRPEEPRACVARHDHGLRDDREKAEDAGHAGVLVG